jgi:NAD(P)H-dependent FMN reductase
MRLLCMGGSLRKGSLTTAVLRTVAADAVASGWSASVFTVNDLPEMFVPDGSYAANPAIDRLGRLVMSADRVLVMTPVYGGTPSGAVTNLLDSLHLFKNGEVGPLAGKRVFVGSVGGGAIAGQYDPQPAASYALEIACSNLGAWVSPRHLELSELAFDSSGALTEPLPADSLRRITKEILHDEAVTA